MNYISRLNSFHRVVRHPVFTVNAIRYESSDPNEKLDNSGVLKSEVINLYKNLIYLSKDWHSDLRPQIKRAFMKNKDITDAEEIRKLIGRGEYVCREITATYHLRKYRAMKRRYYNQEENKHLQDIFKGYS